MLKLAWRNIITRPLNLMLTVILFALGIGLINFLMQLNDQLKDKFDKNLAGIDLVIGAKGSPLQMILCNMYHIDNPTGNISIKEAKPFLKPQHPLIKSAVPLSLGDSYKTHRIVGTNDGMLALYNGEINEGQLWHHDLEVAIGSEVERKLGLKVGDQFHSSHGFMDDDNLEHDHAAFVVVGTLKPSGSVLDQLILTNTSTIWSVHEHNEETHDHSYADHNHDHQHDNSNVDLLSHEDKEITSLLIQFKNRTNFQALNLPRNINENTDMQAASPAIEINRLYAMMGVGTEALRYLAILIAIVSGLSIFISLYKSLRERRHEMALMRVSGASRSSLFGLIISEGLILALIGFIVAIPLSYLAMTVMGGHLSEAYRYTFGVGSPGKNELLLLGLSLLIGLFSALIPAIKAFSTDINKALSEG